MDKLVKKVRVDAGRVPVQRYSPIDSPRIQRTETKIGALMAKKTESSI